ncbi:hypothetical protein HG536_0F02020 [Torulaspora globosa]|uniref:Nucleoporin Nup82 n=1 Tax=Torulaspora globosa TaxID=48254 RepID=A0A7G3ZK41_9SACH|nr:uncharacterized protein HG536_0F02020 [Torulaspora globosa]QLL33877.1 hypothetical protein HG536_0F02020 [Torulaspora globosa]
MKANSHRIFGGNFVSSNASERFFITAKDGSRAVAIEDSTVRWCDTSDQDYNFMPLLSKLGGFKHAVVSKDAEYVCLYSDVEFRMIEIPWGYKDASSMARAFQKCSHKLGRGEARYKQILFHPLACQQNTLVILKDDDSVTIAYWKDITGTKDVVLNLSGGAYSLDSYVSDIESITFGVDGITLYALSISEGADIYSFYPCLPPVIDIPENLLDELMYKSLIQYEELTAETKSEIKENTIKQLQFVSKLRGSQSGVKSREIHSELRQVRAQGPFTMAPFPDEIYGCNGRMICSMPIDQNKQLLIMALDDGKVAIFFQDLEPTMNWAFAGYSFNNSLVLVELIKLEIRSIKQIMVEKKLPGRFSVLADNGMVSVDTTRWSTVLAKCLDESDLRPLGALDFKSETTFLQYNSTPQSVAFWSSNTEQCIVTVTATNIMTKEIIRRHEESEEIKMSSEESVPKKAYEAPYSQHIDEIMQLSRRFQKELAKSPGKIIDPRDRQVPLNNESNEKQLELLTEVSKELFQKIALGQSLGAALHNRLLEQQSDLSHQLKISEELIHKRDGIQDTLAWQTTRFGQLEARHSKLRTRLDKLKDNLSKIGESNKFKQMAISKKEMDWFREIRAQVLMFNQNVRSYQKQHEQLAFLRKELARISTMGADNESRSREEWQELHRMLQEDTRILQKCSHELNIASRQVPANP